MKARTGAAFKRDVYGSKANSIFLGRTPVVCIHGINSGASQWEGSKKMEGKLEEDGFDVWKADHGSDLFQEIKSVLDEIANSTPPLSAPVSDLKILVDEIEKNMHGNSDVENNAAPILMERIETIKEAYRNGKYELPNSASFSLPANISYWDQYNIGGVPIPEVSAIISRWRANENSERKHIHGLQMAIQKTDLVAHSYGGIVSRWYTEKCPDYLSRRDARKLITIGTPHRGSPITNLCSEAYMNPDIYNAGIKNSVFDEVLQWNWVAGADSLGETLDELNKNLVIDVNIIFRKFKNESRIRWYKRPADQNGQESHQPPPPAGGRTGADLVDSLKLLSVNSKFLEDLNENPFLDNMAYACVIGNNEKLVGIMFVNLLDTVEPYQESPGRHSYAPWYSALDAGNGKSDAVVPVWSQRIFDPDSQISYEDFMYVIGESHLYECGNSDVIGKVKNWLKASDLPKGDKVRASFQSFGSKIPEFGSRINIYRGYRKGVTDAGFVSDAIHRIRLVPGGIWPQSFVVSDPLDIVLPKHGGLLQFKCTGTYRGDTPELNTYAYESTLFKDKIDTVTLPLDNGDLRPFSYSFWIGRTANDELQGNTGKTCAADGSSNKKIISSETSFGKSYFNGQVSVEKFSLDIPVGPTDLWAMLAPFSYKLSGGIPKTVYGATTATGEVALWDNNGLLAGDTQLTLKKNILVTSIPASAPVGALVPYRQVELQLDLDADGKIIGNNASSEEVDTDIYQKVEWNGDSKKSDNLHVKTNML
jgi:triacylglycerol esterase/lipase EstA (alpha/beta hydrolase family)